MAYTIEKSTQATGLCKFILDDKTVMEAKNLFDFNTYRNWGYFPGEVDPVWEKNAADNKQVKSLFPNFTVTKSLFSNVHGIGVNNYLQQRSSSLLLDTPEYRKKEKMDSDCSVRALVKNSEEGKMGRQIYRYADFMYCKYLGRMPNNYMVTLRRFPYPCGDQISYMHMGRNETENQIQKHLPDVGRMITWLGTPGNDLENILSFKVKMPFKEVEAELQDVGDAGGDSGGLLGTLMNLGGNSSYQEAILSGYAGSATFDLMNSMFGKVSSMTAAPQYQGSGIKRWKSKSYGNIDTIKKTHKRGDEGLTFENQFTLTFDYELRSYDGINGKAAFLDLLANIIATTYSTGKFWGGGFKGSGVSQHNAFANLPIYKLKPGASFTEIMGSVLESVADVGKAMAGNAGLTGNFLTDAKNIMGNMSKQFANALLGGAINKLGRPMKTALHSLLSPTPVGFWHVTIGNPMHPIVQMGNMIIDDCQIQQYGPLGLDDFPTGIKVTVTLKHGKVRDATMFEQMYHYGDYRIYSPVDVNVKECYENSSRIEQLKRGEGIKTMFDYIKDENEDERIIYLGEYGEKKGEGSRTRKGLHNSFAKNYPGAFNFLTNPVASTVAFGNSAKAWINKEGKNAWQNGVQIYDQKVKPVIQAGVDKAKTVANQAMANFGETDIEQYVRAAQEASQGEYEKIAESVQKGVQQAKQTAKDAKDTFTNGKK